MASITPRKTDDGKTHYRVRVRVKGRPLLTATFPSRKEAEAWAKKVETEIREGRYFGTPNKGKTLADAITKYVDDVIPALKSEADKRHRKAHLEGFWTEHLGPYFLSEITSGKIAELRDQLAKTPKADGKPRSGATVVRYMASLSACLSSAKEWGWIQANPLSGVKRPKESRGRVRFLSDEERDALLKAAKEHEHPIIYALVLLALCSGARQSELLALRWGDVDLVRGQFTINDSKNGERRGVPLVGPARDVLAEMNRVRNIKDDRVFGQSSFPRRAWADVLEVSKVEDFHFHDCRHTCASYLAMNGGSLMEIAHVLGHRTLAMVKRYAHLSEAHTAGVMGRMADKVFGPS